VVGAVVVAEVWVGAVWLLDGVAAVEARTVTEAVVDVVCGWDGVAGTGWDVEVVKACTKQLAPGGGGSRSTVDAAKVWDWVALGKVTKAQSNHKK